MADIETPAPATETPAAEQPQESRQSFEVPTNAEEYAEWRTSGKLPDEPSTKESAPSRAVGKDSAPSSTKSVPGSEPEQFQKRPGKAEGRKEDLNREIRELNDQVNSLRAERERLKQTVETPVKKDVPRESSTAPPAQPQGPQEPVEPNQEDYKTWEEYRAAERKYFKDLANWEAGKRIDEYIQTVRQEAVAREMQVRLDEAKQRYGDEAEPKIFDAAKTVFEHQHIDPKFKTKMGSSPVLVDALYVMGSDQDELRKFVELAVKDPLEALRKWFTVEDLVKKELAKNGSGVKPDASPNGSPPPRDENGQFISAAKPPAKRHAPVPPTELGGNSSPSGDERDRAATSGDVRAFFAEGNRRDMARAKGNL